MTQKVIAEKPAKTITVFVNNREVVLPDKHETGAEIKAAAGIPPDFKLYAEHGHDLDLVGDEEHINVHAKERFRAVSGQDVS